MKTIKLNHYIFAKQNDKKTVGEYPTLTSNFKIDLAETSTVFR